MVLVSLVPTTIWRLDKGEGFGEKKNINQTFLFVLMFQCLQQTGIPLSSLRQLNRLTICP